MDVDLKVVMGEGEYLKREGGVLVGAAATVGGTFDVQGDYGFGGLNAAYDAAVAAGGGVLWLTPGTYTYSTNLTWDSTLVSVVGAGSDVVTLQPSGTAKIVMSRALAGLGQTGRLSGFTLRGAAGAPAGAVGLHLVDITSGQLEDVVIENFTGTGSIGLLLENVNYWTERNSFTRVLFNNNTIGVRLTSTGAGSSFGYNRWTDLRLNVNAGQIGFQTAGTAAVYHNDFSVICNVVGAGVIFDVTGTSRIVRGRILLTAEQTGGAGGKGIRVANGALFAMTGYRSYGLGGLVDENNSTKTSGGTHAGTLRQIPVVAKVDDTYQSLDGGTRPNFIGADTATMIPVVADDMHAMYSGLGFLQGPNIVSMYFAVYNGAGNAWVFYAVPYAGSQGDAVEVARVTCEGAMRPRQTTTAGRPTAASQGVGAMIYDTTLGKPIWSNGTVWKDAAGTAV